MLVAMEAWECWQVGSAACGLEAWLGLALWMLVARMLGTVQSGNLHNLVTEPGGLQAWRLAAWMLVARMMRVVVRMVDGDGR